MGETFAGLVTDGPLLVAAAVAALVGLISFASPCVLPLVPGYLSYVTGLVGAGAGAEAGASGSGGTATAVRTEVSPRARMVLGALLFVLGFTLVFVAFGAAFGGLGRLMLEHADVLNRVFGVITVLVGLGFLGWLPLLQRTKRITARPAAGLAGAPLLGIVFGLGWTPCLGPTLTGVIAVASATDGANVARGVLLVIAYCLGLGIPFVLLAFGSARAVQGLGWLRRHTRQIQIFGGVLLILVGTALVTGVWNDFVSWVRDAFVSDVRLPI
jgi:cytochrome c-type biogenesis protein